MELIEDYTVKTPTSEHTNIQFVISTHSNPNTQDCSVIVSVVIFCNGEPVCSLDYRRDFKSLEEASHYYQKVKTSMNWGWWNVGGSTINIFADALTDEDLLTRSNFEKRVEEDEEARKKVIERIRARQEEIMAIPNPTAPALAMDAVILPRRRHTITIPEIHPDED